MLYEGGFDESLWFNKVGLWCGSTHKYHQGTCSKWSNDLVQDKGIERDIECIGFEGFDKVRFEGSIEVSKGSVSTSYPCVRVAQSNLVLAMRFWKQGWQFSKFLVGLVFMMCLCVL